MEIYKITIVKIVEKRENIKKWQKIRDKEDQDPSGKGELYGYIISEEVVKDSIELYEQTTDKLDLTRVILAVNNL